MFLIFNEYNHISCKNSKNNITAIDNIIAVIMSKHDGTKIIYLVDETTHSRTSRQHEKNVRKQQEVSLVFLLRKQNITIKISF